jgi:hypothetical protein
MLELRVGKPKNTDPVLTPGQLYEYMKLMLALETARPDERARIKQEMALITEQLRMNSEKAKAS